MGLERLVFFSDAVFAIAITLLAIDIRLPELRDPNDAGLLRALRSLWPQYLSYMISFLVIGMYWLGHHRKYRLIKRYDSTLLILNVFLLMLVAFIPFPTSILSEFGSRVAVMLYAGFMTLLGLMNGGVWFYASHHNRLTNLSREQQRYESLRVMSLPTIFALSIGIAFFNHNLAMFSWLFLAVFLFIIRQPSSP